MVLFWHCHCYFVCFYLFSSLRSVQKGIKTMADLPNSGTFQTFKKWVIQSFSNSHFGCEKWELLLENQQNSIKTKYIKQTGPIQPIFDLQKPKKTLGRRSTIDPKGKILLVSLESRIMNLGNITMSYPTLWKGDVPKQKGVPEMHGD